MNRDHIQAVKASNRQKARASEMSCPSRTRAFSIRMVLPACAVALFGAAASVAGEGSAAQSSSSDEHGPKAATDSAALQEVIVTAQKQSQNIQNTPISVTAVSGAVIEQAGIKDISDIARIAPGISVARTGPGENNISIRGISSTVGEQATVGYYLDEVPISSVTQNIDVPLFDLARVEVLRGPQGTIYGSASMGGTIKYVLNEPDLQATTLTVGNDVYHIDDSYGLSDKAHAVFNVPLVSDKLALRAMAFWQSDKGYIDRYAIDPANYLLADSTKPAARNVNTEKFYGLRTELKFKPTDDVTIRPSYMYQKIQQGGFFTIDEPPGDVQAGNFIQTRDLPEQRIYVAQTANLLASAAFRGWELVSSTSYFDTKDVLNEDYSKLGYLLIGAPPGGPIVPFLQTRYTSPTELVEELRANFRIADSFEGVLGVYYSRNRNEFHDRNPISSEWVAAYGDPLAYFGTGYQFYNVMYAGDSYDTFTEKAVFGQSTYSLTPSLRATVGLRASWFQDAIHGHAWGALNGPETFYADSATGKGVAPRFNLSYQLTDDVMVYGTVSKGLRAGAAQTPVPAAVCINDLQQLGLTAAPSSYKPDSLWSYEVGAKTSALDRRVTVNGSVYYINWSDIQQQVALQCGFPFTANFGKAHSRGGELEVRLVPTDHLILTGSAAYTDAKLVTTTPGTQGTAGDPLVDVPKWMGALSAEHSQALAGHIEGFARIDWTYQGETYRNFIVDSPFRTRPSYSLTNLRIGTKDTVKKWSASLYVFNLFNRFAEAGLRHSDTGSDLPDTRPISIVPPRTFGLSLEYSIK